MMPAFYTIYKTLSFESAHRLPGHPKCGKLHGHSYKVEIELSSLVLDQQGFVVDFGEIKKYFEQFDHSDKVIEVSCEILCREAAIYFLNTFPSLTSVKLTISETATSKATIQIER